MVPLHGQPRASALVKAYLKNPESRAFLLYGPPGTGKSTTGHNIAEGVGAERSILGGYEEMPSGDQSADAVRALSSRLRLRPMQGDWRCIVVNECERMSPQAELLWLDMLDPESDSALPPRVVVVFTTNNPDKVSQRFSERCRGGIEFIANSRAVAAFVAAQWAERMPGIPFPDSLQTAGCRPGKSPSYRAALAEIEDALALAELGEDDTDSAADMDTRYWLVHLPTGVWGCFRGAEGELARDMLDTLRREMPHSPFSLSRSAVSVARGGPVPADAEDHRAALLAG